MIGLAINALWLLIGAIALCAIVYLVIYGINNYVHAIPDRVQQAIWFIVLCLVIIAFLSMLAGGGHMPSFR
jgi:hypothetical protein